MYWRPLRRKRGVRNASGTKVRGCGFSGFLSRIIRTSSQIASWILTSYVTRTASPLARKVRLHSGFRFSRTPLGNPSDGFWKDVVAPWRLFVETSPWIKKLNVARATKLSAPPWQEALAPWQTSVNLSSRGNLCSPPCDRRRNRYFRESTPSRRWELTKLSLDISRSRCLCLNRVSRAWPAENWISVSIDHVFYIWSSSFRRCE